MENPRSDKRKLSAPILPYNMLIVGLWLFRIRCPKSARLVYACLWFHRNKKNGRCDPSFKTLAEKAGLSEQQVKRAVEKLRKLHLIKTTTSPSGTNRYTLLVHPEMREDNPDLPSPDRRLPLNAKFPSLFVPFWLAGRMELKETAKMVYSFLESKADPYHRLAQVEIDDIANTLHCHRETCRRALRELENKNLIETRPGGQHQASTYRLLLHIWLLQKHQTTLRRNRPADVPFPTDWATASEPSSDPTEPGSSEAPKETADPTNIFPDPTKPLPKENIKRVKFKYKPIYSLNEGKEELSKSNSGEELDDIETSAYNHNPGNFTPLTPGSNQHPSPPGETQSSIFRGYPSARESSPGGRPAPPPSQERESDLSPKTKRRSRPSDFDYLAEAESDPEWKMLKRIYPKERFTRRIAKRWDYRRNYKQGLICEGDMELIFRRFRLADIPDHGDPIGADDEGRPIFRPKLPDTLEAFLVVDVLLSLISEAQRWDEFEKSRWVSDRLQEELGGRYCYDEDNEIVSMSYASICGRISQIITDWNERNEKGPIGAIDVQEMLENLVGHERVLVRSQWAWGLKAAGEDPAVAFASVTEEECLQVRTEMIGCPMLYQDYSKHNCLATYYGLSREAYREGREHFLRTYNDLIAKKTEELLGAYETPALQEMEAYRNSGEEPPWDDE